MAHTLTYEEDLAVFRLKLKCSLSLTREQPGVIALASAMKGSSAAPCGWASGTLTIRKRPKQGCATRPRKPWKSGTGAGKTPRGGRGGAGLRGPNGVEERHSMTQPNWQE